jgi:hypothetical protein
VTRKNSFSETLQNSFFRSRKVFFDGEPVGKAVLIGMGPILAR